MAERYIENPPAASNGARTAGMRSGESTYVDTWPNRTTCGFPPAIPASPPDAPAMRPAVTALSARNRATMRDSRPTHR
jgi:hypothetical protein